MRYEANKNSVGGEEMNSVKVQEHIRKVVMHPLPQLRSLPAMLPLEGAVRIELEEGVSVFRASKNGRFSE